MDDMFDGGILYFYMMLNKFVNVDMIYLVFVDCYNFYGLIDCDFCKIMLDISMIKIEYDIMFNFMVCNIMCYMELMQDYIWMQLDDSQGNVVNGKVWCCNNNCNSLINSFVNLIELFGEFCMGLFKYSFMIGIELLCEWGKCDLYMVVIDKGMICQKGIGVLLGYNCMSLWLLNLNDLWVGLIMCNNDYVYVCIMMKLIYGFDMIEIMLCWQVNVGLCVDDYLICFIDIKVNGGKMYMCDDMFFNWQVGFVFKFVQNGSIYVLYVMLLMFVGMLFGEGSEMQLFMLGCGGVGLNVDQFLLEKNCSIEFGMKWNVLNDKLLLMVVLFQIDMMNVCVMLLNNQYVMVGNKCVQGFEFGFVGQIMKQWQVFGGYMYMKSELCDNGKDIVNNGNCFLNMLKYSFMMWLNYDVMLKFMVGGGVFYMLEVFGDFVNLCVVLLYWCFDVMVQYWINKKFDL